MKVNVTLYIEMGESGRWLFNIIYPDQNSTIFSMEFIYIDIIGIID